MRQIGAVVRLDADARRGLVDLLVQRLQRLVRRDAGPERHRLAAPLERAEAVERDLEARDGGLAPSAAWMSRGQVPVDLADEAQGEVELVRRSASARRVTPPISAEQLRRGPARGGRMATNRRCMAADTH